MKLVNQNTHNEPLWKIILGTGLAWTENFEVYAQHETEALDIVADYLMDNKMTGLFSDHYELSCECENMETVDEYAEANGLVCCGNYGIYLQVLHIQKINELLADLLMEQREQM